MHNQRCKRTEKKAAFIQHTQFFFKIVSKIGIFLWLLQCVCIASTFVFIIEL